MTMPTEIIQKIVAHLVRDCDKKLLVFTGYERWDVVDPSLESVHIPTKVMKLVHVSKEFSRITRPIIWSRLSKNMRIWCDTR